MHFGAGAQHADQPPAILDQPDDAVHQHEMAEMVGAELPIEPVRGLFLRAGHDAGIGDDDVECLARRVLFLWF